VSLKTRTHSVIIPVDGDGQLVERSAPGAAPSAFRIWAAGENLSDDGAIYFTRESARLLMEEQAARGRVYSIDFDHLSLTQDRPAESGRAAGWHALQARVGAGGEPELWAVGLDWCADARAGLEEQPPRWRFFSPAFVTNKAGEVVSYINLALCINPKTHQLPSLAARTCTAGVPPVKKATLLAALAALAASAPDEDKKSLEAARSYAEKCAEDGDDDEKKKDAEEAPPESKKEEKSAEDAPPDSKKGEEEKTETKAHAHKPGDAAALAMADELVKANRRIEKLEIDKLLDGRKDLPEAVRTWCSGQSAEVVKSFLATMPKTSAPRDKSPAPTATGPALLEGSDRDEMDRAMGLTPKAAAGPTKDEHGRLVLHTQRPSDFRTGLQKGQG